MSGTAAASEQAPPASGYTTDAEAPQKIEQDNATSGETTDVEAAKNSETLATETAVRNPREHIPKWKWTLTVIGLYLGGLLYGLDTTIAADVQVSVYQTLGNIEDLAWVGLGFPMASSAAILFLGRAYGLFDVKILMLGSIATFEVGSALCGAAPNSAALIVGRVIAGIGGAGMYLGGLTYVGTFATPTEAALLNAGIGLSWGVGAILGPVIGGGFSVSSATWRWAFYINLPLAALFSPVYFFMFPRNNPRKDLTLAGKFKQIDWVGTVLVGAVLVLFNVVVTFGGSTYPWNSSASIALWVVFGVTLIAFILQQYFVVFTSVESRIFPGHYIKKPVMIMLFVIMSCVSTCMATTLYYVPLYFQFTHGDSALQAAVRLLPYIIIFIFFVMLAGGTLPMVGRYNIYYLFGGALLLVGGALMFTINADTNIARIYGAEVLLATGVGFTFQNAYAVAAAKVPASDLANAIGFINLAQIGSSAVALSIAGTLFQNLGFEALKNAFEGYGFADDVLRSALAGTISPIFQAADPTVVRIAVVTVAETIQRTFGTVLAAASLMLVTSALLPWEKISLDIVAGG